MTTYLDGQWRRFPHGPHSATRHYIANGDGRSAKEAAETMDGAQ